MKKFQIALVFLLTTAIINAQPNVVLIIGDDISADDIGCYGNSFVSTPNIDKLASRGIKFTNAYLTISSCSPSRTSILTGRYPHNTGAAELHTNIPDNQVLFPKLLKDNGYYTAQAGKWHLGESGKTPAGIAVKAFDKAGGHMYDGGGESGAEKWITRLRERPKDKPFFMWFAPHDAHHTWDNKMTTRKYTPEEVVVPALLTDNPQLRKDLAAFYNEVTRLDYYVGEVMKELEAQGVLDNTIFIFMSDNGRPFPGYKTYLVTGGIKPPLIISWPKGIKGEGLVSNSLISSIDIAPTVLEACGVKPIKAIQGKSFLDLFQQPDKPFRNYVFAEHNWHGYTAYERMVSDGKYLYIENGLPHGANWQQKKIDGKFLTTRPAPKKMLYDLTKDPVCRNNVFANGDYASVANNLSDKLEKWKQQTGDYQPDNLTKDWYKNGKESEHVNTRGEMPGARTGAIKINHSGPF